jgi:2-polyprenyl-3-methyl-5-hydroxy-6-metoxy-1,4-benzoquinol methylase
MGKLLLRRNPNNTKLWDKIYQERIQENKILSDAKLPEKFGFLFERADSILDFGGGMGGNLKLLSGQLQNKRFILIDYSQASLDFARNTLLGEKDERGNRFEYAQNMDQITDKSIHLVMSFQTLEHISDYRKYMDILWEKTSPGGTMLISVPVKGIRDRQRQHVNKFTVSSMFKILTHYGEFVHISPRSYSKRAGRLSTAYFYVEKKP